MNTAEVIVNIIRNFFAPTITPGDETVNTAVLETASTGSEVTRLFARDNDRRVSFADILSLP